MQLLPLQPSLQLHVVLTIRGERLQPLTMQLVTVVYSVNTPGVEICPELQADSSSVLASGKAMSKLFMQPRALVHSELASHRS